jgi:hypothetical protein
MPLLEKRITCRGPGRTLGGEFQVLRRQQDLAPAKLGQPLVRKAGLDVLPENRKSVTLERKVEVLME